MTFLPWKAYFISLIPKVIVSLNDSKTEFSSCLIAVDSSSQKVRSFLLSSIWCTSISSLRASVRSTCVAAILTEWVSERGAFSTGPDNVHPNHMFIATSQFSPLLTFPFAMFHCWSAPMRMSTTRFYSEVRSNETMSFKWAWFFSCKLNCLIIQRWTDNWYNMGRNGYSDVIINILHAQVHNVNSLKVVVIWSKCLHTQSLLCHLFQA